MFKKILIIFTFLIFSNSHAEQVNSLVIDGNKRISDETIKVYGGIEINKDISENELNKIVRNLYSTNFFNDVSANIDSNTLYIKVSEYPLINQLVIIGENRNSFTDEIKKLISLKENKSFIRSSLAKDISVIKEFYASLGYNFTEIETKSKIIDQDNLDLIIEINRGNQTKISEIKFLGNNLIKSRRLKDIIVSEEDKFWKVLSRNTNFSENLVNLDKRLLENYYKSIGYYDVSVDSSAVEIDKKEGKAKIIYTINEGERFFINKISTNVDKVFDKEIFFPLNEIYKEYVGNYYSPFKIKKLLDELDKLIELNNLQYVEHNVQENVNNDKIDIVFNVYEGEKNLVERVNITGNSITNEEVIRSELILDEGDPFVNLSLEKSIAEIKARRIFKDVKYNVENGSSDNLKVINIEVQEQPTGEISAGAGVGTSGGTFAFNVKENNWLGEGKAVAFDVQFDAESLIGELSYVNPNYNFLGNSLNFSISSESNDKPDKGYENSVITGLVGTSFEQFRDVNIRLGLSASYDDLRTENTASASLKRQKGTFSELATNYGFSIDKRDRAFMPTDGFITSFNQEIPIYADKPFIANTFLSSVYQSFGQNIIGSSKFYFSTINSTSGEDVRISKRKGLSTRRLRGFEQNKVGPVDGSDHIGGNYAAAINLETNLPNLLPDASNVDVGLFLDFGNVWGVDYDKTIDESNEIRSTTGLTASWESPLGPMTFVFSQNLLKADTDKTESFNFNLGTTF